MGETGEEIQRTFIMLADGYHLTVLPLPHQFRLRITVGLAREGDILMFSYRHGAFGGKGVQYIRRHWNTRGRTLSLFFYIFFEI
jgi:hypothetical protein